MISKARTALILLVVMTVLTGIIYPLAMTGIAQLLLSRQANGSLVDKNGTTVGSSLIGQSFSGPRYFHGRPSAAGPKGYDAAASSGSNLGPTNKVLTKTIAQRAALVRKENGLAKNALVPADLVTASGSGLDPDISPASAYLQVRRVANARGLPESTVRALVSRNALGRQLGVLGEARVNVLQLNLDLDALKP